MRIKQLVREVDALRGSFSRRQPEAKRQRKKSMRKARFLDSMATRRCTELRMIMRLDLHWVRLAGLKDVSESLLAPGFTGCIWTRNGQLDPYGFAWPLSATHSTSFGRARASKFLDDKHIFFKNHCARPEVSGAMPKIL
jgi:hypothetical protein